MRNQISIFDIDPKAEPNPGLWECMKTCKHMGKYMDQFPLGGDRCLYGIHMDGTSGNHMYEEISLDGTVKVFCKYYERDEEKNGDDQD